MSQHSYHSYRNLPPIAGIGSMTDAMRTGLSVEECVRRLKRYHYALKRLHGIFTARITAEPIYELKSAFSLHSHYCAEHVASLRKRVAEMREPPLHLDVFPEAALEILFDEILAAPTTEQLVLGLYEVALPALIAGFERHLRDTNPLADHPSVRVCRFALLELNEAADFGRQAVRCLVDDKTRQQAAGWLALLAECLAVTAAGWHGDAGEKDSHPAAFGETLRLRRRAEARQPVPDPYNMGVNAEMFLYNPAFPRGKTLMMFYKRLREIDVPEMMAGILSRRRANHGSITGT